MALAGNNGYPQPGDYNDVLQYPDRCFADPELRSRQPERLSGSYLRTWTGGNAVVFRLSGAGKSFAVKLFKHRNDERQNRYKLLADYLRGVKSRHLIDFQYQEKGICVGGQWYPLLRMDWVPGVTLQDWVRERFQRNDGPALGLLAERWVELIGELAANKITHGDLQHGNVLVHGQQLMLVDYDGMWVPTLPDATITEGGLPAYQHPKREGQQAGPDCSLDSFSAWIIWIALRAVAQDLSLWKRYVVDRNNESLLFLPADITNAAQSKLWDDLLKSRDGEVVRRARDLRRSIAGPFKDVPAFKFETPQEMRKQADEAPRTIEPARVAEQNRAQIVYPPDYGDKLQRTPPKPPGPALSPDAAELRSALLRDPADSELRRRYLAHRTADQVTQDRQSVPWRGTLSTAFGPWFMAGALVWGGLMALAWGNSGEQLGTVLLVGIGVALGIDLLLLFAGVGKGDTIGPPRSLQLLYAALVGLHILLLPVVLVGYIGGFFWPPQMLLHGIVYYPVLLGQSGALFYHFACRARSEREGPLPRGAPASSFWKRRLSLLCLLVGLVLVSYGAWAAWWNSQQLQAKQHLRPAEQTTRRK